MSSYKNRISKPELSNVFLKPFLLHAFLLTIDNNNSVLVMWVCYLRHILRVSLSPFVHLTSKPFIFETELFQLLCPPS